MELCVRKQILSALTNERFKKIMDEMIDKYGEKLYCYAEHYPKIFESYLKLYKQSKELKEESIL